MAVQSVMGPVEADDLGITLPHEHLLIDLRKSRGQYPKPRVKR